MAKAVLSLTSALSRCILPGVMGLASWTCGPDSADDAGLMTLWRMQLGRADMQHKD